MWTKRSDRTLATRAVDVERELEMRRLVEMAAVIDQVGRIVDEAMRVCAANRQLVDVCLDVRNVIDRWRHQQ